MSRGVREVDDAAFVHQVAAVSDANYHGSLVGPVHDPHQGAKGEGRMAGCHGVHIEEFTAGGFAAIEDATVPGGEAVHLALPLRTRGLEGAHRGSRRDRDD